MRYFQQFLNHQIVVQMKLSKWWPDYSWNGWSNIHAVVEQQSYSKRSLQL